MLSNMNFLYRLQNQEKEHMSYIQSEKYLSNVSVYCGLHPGICCSRFSLHLTHLSCLAFLGLMNTLRYVHYKKSLHNLTLVYSLPASPSSSSPLMPYWNWKILLPSSFVEMPISSTNYSLFLLTNQDANPLQERNQPQFVRSEHQNKL